jgi:hypothetical protein
MRSKQTPKLQVTFFESSRVFLALLIAVLFFLAPINRGENENTAMGRFYSLIAVPCAGADDCPDPCKVWYCGHKIPGGPCLEWTYHCAGCDNGGGGTYFPPTISHTFTCTNSGVNDWCIGNLTLNLTATDPQGQTIIVSGEVDGNSFVCPSTDATCQISMPEGAGLVTYRVDSLTGLSATGTTSYQLDATTPEITGAINASLGTNGWYNSQTFVTASASDALSGLTSLEVNIDNTGWASYSDTTFTDGMHTIQFRASDNAGNVTETVAQAVNVDTTAPTLSLVATGVTGQDGWYVSAVTFTPTVSDALSGLASLEATIDGVNWNSAHAPITLGDGTYTVQFRATDQAGNVSLTPLQQINVDATTPSLSLDINGTKGENGWYVTHVSVAPYASDAGAGVNKIEVAINNGAWSTVNGPLSFSDGSYLYQIRITDNAGNVTETPLLSLKVDTLAPAIAIDDSLSLGDTLYYDLEDMGSGLWINRTVIEDDDEKYKKVVWLTEAVGQKANGEIRWDGVFADGTRAALGEYFITLKISDRAGNETLRTAIVNVTALSALIPIPAFTPPSNHPLLLGENFEEEETLLEFGGTNNGNTGGETGTVVSDGQAVVQGKTGWTSESASFSSGNRSANVPVDASNVLWGAAAAAVLGMTLADWQRKREEEAARLAAERANEVPDDVRARRRAKVIAKNQAKRAQERAWEQARQAQQTQNVVAKNNNLNKAEAEMDKVKPVTPYVAASYIDNDEEKWLKGQESQRAWAAVNAQ